MKKIDKWLMSKRVTTWLPRIMMIAMIIYVAAATSLIKAVFDLDRAIAQDPEIIEKVREFIISEQVR